MSKYICNTTKYEVGGPSNETIGLHVKISGIPSSIEVEGYTLQIKTDFHVTLVPVGKIRERHTVTVPDFQEQVTSDFCKFVAKKDVELVRYTGFRFASDAELRSVVAMCDVSNLAGFYDDLNQKYGLNVETPPTHVTLYTLQPNRGIFLVDSSDIERLTKPVDVANEVRDGLNLITD